MSRDLRRRPPLALLVPGVVAVLLFVLPLVGLLGRVPWSRLSSLLSSRVVVDALWLSLTTSVAAALLSLVLGVPLAWLLSRAPMRGRSVLRALVTLPMVLPPVVGGAALLFAFGRRGVIGEPLHDVTGFLLPFSWWGVVVANAFVAMPFLVLTVEGALSAVDRRYEAAAASLGAGQLMTFRQVTLPMITPSLAAGALLAWARALGEFGATITFNGNLQGRTQTLPLAVFLELEGGDRDVAVSVSLVLVAVSFLVLVSMRQRWWPSR